MPPLKALSGGGYIRGRGDFACSEANPHLQIQTPPPYEKKKQKLRILKKRYFAVAQYDKKKKNKEKGKSFYSCGLLYVNLAMVECESVTKSKSAKRK